MTDKIAAAEGLRDWLFDRAEKLDDDGFPNGASGNRLWAAAVEALLAERAALREALALAEDVLSRFPYSAELWPNGMHPNAGITKIRAALKCE